jgi:hypothetical protein
MSGAASRPTVPSYLVVLGSFLFLFRFFLRFYGAALTKQCPWLTGGESRFFLRSRQSLRRAERASVADCGEAGGNLGFLGVSRGTILPYDMLRSPVYRETGRLTSAALRLWADIRDKEIIIPAVVTAIILSVIVSYN